MRINQRPFWNKMYDDDDDDDDFNNPCQAFQ